MDIFKQKNYLIFIIVILIILNLGMLTMMWLHKPPRDRPPEHPQNRPDEGEQISSMLKQELDLNDEQIQNFIELRRVNHEKIDVLQNEIREIKRKMFDSVLLENSDEISDSLLSIMLEKQGQIEKMIHQHFVDLKNLCNDEQQKHLQSLLQKLIPPPDMNGGPPPGKMDNRPPPPPGEMGDQPQLPGEFGDQPPPPPK